MLAGAGMFVFGIVMALVGAVVPTLTTRLALTLADVGTLFLVMNFAMLVASLALGLVVDRLGLKLPLAMGAWLVAAGLAVVATAGSMSVLLLAVACLGLGGGALNGGTNTLVADLHDDERTKGAALNRLGVFFGFGALMLPFLIGTLTSRFGVAALLQAAAVLCTATGLAGVMLVFPLPKQTHGWPLASVGRFARLPLVRALALLLFFQSGNEFLLGGYISSFLTRELEVSADMASYWLAAFWASIMVMRLVLGRLLLQLPGTSVVLASAAAAAGGALILATASSLPVAAAGILITGLALAGIFPTVLGLASGRFREQSGAVFGLLFTIALSGGMTMPWVAGRLADVAGIRWVFALAAAGFTLVAIFGAAARRELRAST